MSVGRGRVRATDLVGALDAELDAVRFQDGQENGLQVEGRGEVERLATAVSVSAEVIDAAIAWGADALLTHHGLLWHNQPLHVRGVRRARLARLLEADLNLITYHLPLDAHPKLGNNAALAEAAGCPDATPAFIYRGQTIGMMGTVAPTSFSDWLEHFRPNLTTGCDVQTGPWHVWPFGPGEVTSIGCVSGAAPYQVQDAIDAGLDLYITGEVTEGIYHLCKEAGIHFVAPGHYLTERGGVQRLGAWCAERFGVTHRFFDVTTEA